MPRRWTLAGDVADAHQQLAVDTVQTLTMEPACTSLILNARTQNVFITFDDSAPSTTNGITVIAAAQPWECPIGYFSHSSHNLKALGAAAGGKLDVLQIAQV